MKLKLLAKVYIIGLIIVSIILLLRTVILLFNSFTGDISIGEHFYKENIKYVSTGFSVFEHPTYLALKLVFAIVLIYYFNREVFLDIRLRIIIVILFSLIIILLASKAGILYWFFLIIFFSFVKNFNMLKKKYIHFIVLIFSLIFVFIFVFNYIERIDFFISSISGKIKTWNFDLKDLDQRTREWHCALQLIKEKPIFGHGIGRVEDRMVEEYLKNRWEEEARLRYNAHNQFLETQMTFGIPGTLSLLWMLFTPLIHRKKLLYPKLATAFVLTMTFFLMFESMFVRQWGIMFFTLFYCILVFPAKEKKKTLFR